MEAIVLASSIDAYNSIPYFMRVLPNSYANGPFIMSNVELKSLMDLRDQVFRIWSLLQTSKSFDPELLQPVLQVRLKLYHNSMMPTILTNYTALLWTLVGATINERVDVANCAALLSVYLSIIDIKKAYAAS